MSYKISIIIPVYNIEKYLTKTLDSILKQSIGAENIEVILVNDNSTDGTKGIIDEYVAKYENFIGIHLTENSGLPGRPRNIGLQQATGDYVMFMDHDDFYEEDACEILYDKISKEEVDIVFCRYSRVFDDGIKRRFPSIFKDIEEIKIESIDENEKLLLIAPSIWTKLFKREFLEINEILFPEGILGEDLSFVVNSFLSAKGIVYLNNYYGYNYRIRDTPTDKSTINIRNKKFMLDMISGYYNTYQILKDKKREDLFPIIFESHLKFWMSTFIFSDTTDSEKKDLLGKIAPLFEKQSECGFTIDDSYLILFNHITNKEFDKAIFISKALFESKKRENKLLDNHHLLQENYKKLRNTKLKLEKNNKKLKTNLEERKKQVAELQTVTGWLNYKTKNISCRIKRKIKN